MLDAWRKRLGAWSREIDLDSGIPGGSGTLESQRPRLRLCSYCDAAIKPTDMKLHAEQCAIREELDKK